MRAAFRARILMLCVCVAALVLVLDAYWSPLQRLELRTLDWRFARRGPRERGSEVALVTIDEQSLAEPGLRHWPWPRSRYAELIDVLHARGAAVVAFDLGFAERQDPHEDGALAAAARRAGNVLLAAGYAGRTMGRGGSAAQEAPEVTMDRLRSSDALAGKLPRAPRPAPAWLGPPTREFLWTLPIPELAAAARAVGAVNIAPDPDGIFRRVPPAWLVDNGRLYPHLAVLAAALKLGVAPERIAAGRAPAARPVLSLGDRRSIALLPDGTLLIDYAGPPLTAIHPPMFPCYPFSEVLKLRPRSPGSGKELRAGGIPPDAFRGKIVFVGATAPGLSDQRPTPFASLTSGVEMHASVADAILRNRFFHPLGPGDSALLVIGAGLLAGVLMALPTMLGATLATAGLAMGYALLAVGMFRGPRVLLPVTSPLLTIGACYVFLLAYRFQGEYRERQRSRAYLDLYVPPQVAERILGDPRAVALGGQRVEVSVLFADIRGFTPLSEARSPEAMLALLNEYFDRMVSVIMEQEGTLVHYAGDMIMAAWGAPVAQPEHARQAVRAGIGMLAALRRLQAEWRERGLPVFDIGIGINSGEAVAGNVGGRKRMQYAVIGDVVNAAARLESLNKEMETHMIIGEATYLLTRDLVDVRPLGEVTVRGKTESLTVYEVLGLRECEPRGNDGEMQAKGGKAGTRATPTSGWPPWAFTLRDRLGTSPPAPSPSKADGEGRKQRLQARFPPLHPLLMERGQGVRCRGRT